MNCLRFFSCISLPSTFLPPSLPLTFWRAEAWPLNTLQSFSAPKPWNLQYFQCMESPQIPQTILVFTVCGVLWSHGCRTFAMDFFYQNFCSCYRFPTYAKGIFQGSFSPRVQNAIPEWESTDGTKVGIPRGFLILRHRFGCGFSWKTVPFLPCTKRNTPNLCHPKNHKAQATFKAFSQWFLWALDPGMRRCFWMPAFLCWSTKIVSESFCSKNF